MPERSSDHEDNLVTLAQQGDRNAYGELVSRHYDRVIRVVYRLCGDAQVAQDATQEAFIRAWVKIDTFRPRTPFRNWVYRIAANAAYDILRRKPEEQLEENEGTLSMVENSPGPEAAYIEKEQAAFL